MLEIYFILCLIIVFLSRLFVSKSLCNPINIYTAIWFFIFFLHESSYIQFDEISEETFMIIIVAHISFVVGGFAGFKIKFKIFKNMFRKRDEYEKKVVLTRILIILSVITAIGVVDEFYHNNLSYGFNIVDNFAMMYKDQLEKDMESNLKLSSLVNVVTPLLGIYILNYGMKLFLIIPFLDLLLFGMSNGSRGSFIILMGFLGCFITLKFYNNLNVDKVIINNINRNRKKIIQAVAVAFVIIVLVTISRNNAKTIAVDNPVITFLVTYLAAGIGGLDQFIESPDIVYYPQYFFRVPFIFFNKLGITQVDTFYTVPTFFIPFSTNVYTYIGELIHDFGYLYFIPCFLLGYLSCLCYYYAVKYRLVFYMIMYSGLFCVICLSFFANFGHTASLWYLFVLGGGIGIVVDNKFSI